MSLDNSRTLLKIEENSSFSNPKNLEILPREILVSPNELTPDNTIISYTASKTDRNLLPDPLD